MVAKHFYLRGTAAVTPSDHPALIELALDTGLFTADEANALLGTVLQQEDAHALAAGHQVICCRTRPNGPPVGWYYLAPDDHAEGVWNLWWIGVSPPNHGCGAGKLLLSHAEQVVVASGGRLLIIETSDSGLLARARHFYIARGYRECGRIPDFYSDGESRVIFSRRLRAVG